MVLKIEMMYSAFFEAQTHSKHDKPIGRVIALSDPDIFPAESNEKAIKEAVRRAEINEDLKSLRLTTGGSSKKFLVRVRMIRKNLENEIIFLPKYKEEEFKTIG